MTRLTARSGHRLAIWFASALALAALSLTGGRALAHHREYASRTAPGDFSYYLLSLSWSPAFCAESRGAAECAGPTVYGFIVHGLWPQRDRGRTEYCAARARVPVEVARGIADLMPARGLVYHEWQAHGSCSGLEPAAYFALLRRAAASIRIPPTFQNPLVARITTPRAIAGEFVRANPSLRTEDIVVACSRGGVPRLTEVRVCLDRDLSPRACSAATLAGSCRAPRARVLPVR